MVTSLGFSSQQVLLFKQRAGLPGGLLSWEQGAGTFSCWDWGCRVMEGGVRAGQRVRAAGVPTRGSSVASL